MFKNYRIFVTTTLLFFSLLLAWQSAHAVTTGAQLAQTPDRDLPQILQQKKLVVAIPKHAAPIFFATDKEGKQSGLSIDMANDIAKKMGVEIVFNRDAETYNDLVKLLANNEADVIIADLSKTISRGKNIVYTNTYVRLHPALFINRTWIAKQHKNPLKEFNTMEAVNSSKCRVGVLKETSLAEYAQNIIPKSRLVFSKTWSELVGDLEKDKIDAIFDDDVQAKKLLLDDPTRALKYKIIVLKDYYDLIGFATPEHRRLLRHWLNLYLELKNKVFTSDDLLEYAKQLKHKTPKTKSVAHVSTLFN